MTRLKVLFFVMICALAGKAQSPGYIQNAVHQPSHLDTTDGRKLLIVLLPTKPDTAFTGQLLRFQARHGEQVRIIGMLTPGTARMVTADRSNTYVRLLAAGILLTEGMAQTDSIAGPRSGILKYLSNKNRNRQIDHFAEGGKYFLSEKGRLYAQLGKTTSLDTRLADYIVQTHVPGESRIQ
jgi:hypothetical protein